MAFPDPLQIEPARLIVDGDRVVDADHGDWYFQYDGIDETRYVYLEGSGLLDRLAAHEDLVVGEIGFGTGLSFRLVCAAMAVSGSLSRVLRCAWRSEIMSLSRSMNVDVPLNPPAGTPALAAARWPVSTDVCTACPDRFSITSPAQHPLSPSSRNGLRWLLHATRAVQSPVMLLHRAARSSAQSCQDRSVHRVRSGSLPLSLQGHHVRSLLRPHAAWRL